jgi:hypothetical protein
MSPWARLDDNFHAHPRTLMSGLEANGLFARALSYCAHYLTDGYVPMAWVDAQGSKRAAKKLTDAGLWEPIEDGFRILGYLDANPSRDDIEETRGKDGRKHALHRDKQLVNAIRARDGDQCRYCAITVDWTDRRSSKGGTYDHVDPAGDNSMENVVVACRGCNAVKGKRTPDQAGIELRPTPNLIPIRSGSGSGSNRGAGRNGS